MVRTLSLLKKTHRIQQTRALSLSSGSGVDWEDVGAQKRSFSLAPAATEVDLGKQWTESCSKHTIWSWSAQKAVDPLVMAKAQGIYFWDDKGKRYTDFNSQLMCTNIGHQHPKVIQAIKDQADELCFASPAMATRVRSELGPILAKHTPENLNKFFFTLGGSESNENAIKLARLHTGRQKIISRYKGYHGATHASMMLTGDPRRWPVEQHGGMSGVVRVFDPYMYRSILYEEGMTEEEFSARCILQLEETIMYEGPNNIAAMIMETVTGTNGLIPPPKGYLKGVRETLSKYGILMICDEVMAGLGRCGDWFACQVYDVEPDILCMAKGVTSAYLPLGVVAMTDEIASSFDNRMFSGGLTYSGHPMCLAAAVATLNVMEEEKIIDNTQKMGVVLRRCLERMKEKHPSVGDVRSVGLFGGMELVKNRKTKEPLAPYNGSHPAIVEMNRFLRENGVFCFMAWNIFHTNPPLIITEEQIEETFEVIDQALNFCDNAYEG
jgi:taurine---2-oxoglutarate transaminase